MAARGYLATRSVGRTLISSDLERVRRRTGVARLRLDLPLGNGEVNIGVGALATLKRPADVALRPLMKHYTDLKREAGGFEAAAGRRLGATADGGAVSGVAGPNWMLIGDAAARVNPSQRRGHRLRARDRLWSPPN